jgi:hypothetical protein
MAVQSGKPVQDIDSALLSAKLRNQGAVFDWVPPVNGPTFFEGLFRRYLPDAGKRSTLPGW